MKEFLAWLAASSLGLVAAATAAHAGCVAGVRVPPVAGPDYCVSPNYLGVQTDAAPIDNFGTACDLDGNQNCISDIYDTECVIAKFGLACGTCTCDYNGDGVVGAPDLLHFGMVFSGPSIFPDDGF